MIIFFHSAWSSLLLEHSISIDDKLHNIALTACCAHLRQGIGVGHRLLSLAPVFLPSYPPLFCSLLCNRNPHDPDHFFRLLKNCNISKDQTNLNFLLIISNISNINTNIRGFTRCYIDKDSATFFCRSDQCKEWSVTALQRKKHALIQVKHFAYIFNIV